MSFDLYFCQQSGVPRFDPGHLRRLFSGRQNFEVYELTDGNIQVWYENPVTAVTFSFDWCDPTRYSEDDPRFPSRFLNTGLSFNLNYNRPTFFAVEAMPFVKFMVDELRLQVANPQESDGELVDVLGFCTVEALVASWERHNTWAVRSLHNDPELKAQYRFLSREKAVHWWQYMTEKDNFQDQQEEDIFVPSIMLLCRKGQIKLQTAVLWSDALPQVFPPCDLIVRNVMREINGEMNSIDKRVLSFQSFVDRTRGIAESCRGPVANLRVLRPHQEEKFRNIFNALDGHPFDNYDLVSPDGFVDVYLGELDKPPIQ